MKYQPDGIDALFTAAVFHITKSKQYGFAGRLDGLEAGGGVRYVGSTFSPGDDFIPELTTPSYTVYDAMLAYSWDDYGSP